jgi:hypothetical protein
MSASPELPFAAVDVDAERDPAFFPNDVADEEFPPDLPVNYDWILQPASQRRFRRALGFLAVAVGALLLSAFSYLVYRLPGLIVPLCVVLTVAVLLGVAIKVLASVFGGRELDSSSAWNDLPLSVSDLKN